MAKKRLATKSSRVRYEWSQVIFSQHPCESSGCDIAVALRNGFLEAASWLLHGATETPELDAFEHSHRIHVTDDIWLIGWSEFHKEFGRKCPSCESFMYADENEPAVCSNCRADMIPRPHDHANLGEPDADGDVWCESCQNWVTPDIITRPDDPLVLAARQYAESARLLGEPDKTADEIVFGPGF